MNKLKEPVMIICILAMFYFGSYHCKNVLDSSPELNFNKSYVSHFHNKLITQLMFLNKHVAISQLYQFQMIAHRTLLDIPHGGSQDKINNKKIKIHKKYKIMNLSEYYDYEKYYKLMHLSLEFDPNNDFTRELATHLSLNYDMIKKALQVLKSVYSLSPSWQYAFDIGWFKFYCLRDYEGAREWFLKAQEFQDAPQRVYNIYNITYALEKRYDSAIMSTYNQLQKITDPKSREQLEDKLKWYQGLDRLVKASLEFKKQYGRDINDLNELIERGLLNEIPHDPVGDGFYWNTEMKEPLSENNPFDLILNRNPVAIDRIDINESDDEINEKTAGFF